MGYMGMIIDNIIIRVLSYPTDLQTGILLIASTGIKFAIQKGSFDEFFRGTQRGYSSKPLNIALLNVF